MTDNGDMHFFKTLMHQLANDAHFTERLAIAMVARLGGGTGAKGGAPAPTGRKRGRPRKTEAAPAKPAKRAAAPVAGGSNTDRVLKAIRGGANTKREIMAKAGVTNVGYQYAVRVLKERNAIRIEGIKRMAKILAN